MEKKFVIIGLVLMTAALFAVGCGAPAAEAETETEQPAPTATVSPEEDAGEEAGLPNPASAYCIEQGGELEIRTGEDGGQYGVCMFEDGSECEEWAYYKGECHPGEQMPEGEADGGPVGMPNPASAYCIEQGGELEMRTDADGGQYGVCVFEDGSECEEWDFYNGDCQPGQQSTASEPAGLPAYVNDPYGFSLDPSSEWAIEGDANQVVFRQKDYFLFVGFKWVDEDLPPFRTGMPAGEFADGGTITVLGQAIQKNLLVYEGKTKVVSYGMIEADNLQFYVWLDAEQLNFPTYEEIDIPAEIQAAADTLLMTLTLSGEGATSN